MAIQTHCYGKQNRQTTRPPTPSNLSETFIRIAVVYIANASPIEKEEIRKIANNLPLKLDDMVKTAYEQFVEEGILIGEIKGKIEGKKEGKIGQVYQNNKSSCQKNNSKSIGLLFYQQQVH